MHVGSVVSAFFYGIERIAEAIDGVEPYAKEVMQGWNNTVYVKNVEREIRKMPFPLLIQQLSSIEEFVLERGGSVYVIRPFKSIRIESSNGRWIFGKFYGIENAANDEVVVKYFVQKWEGEVEMYDSIKVVFTPSLGDARVEKVYSGRSELCILRVLTPKLSTKQEIRMMSIYVSNDNEEEGCEKHWMDCLGYEPRDGSNNEMIKQELRMFEKSDDTSQQEEENIDTL
ncbi:hypothetical protein HK407_08g13170 [Ordospora pajunii]|uniref:uncharacterized protein n=1 Tax=Ordospora pajunii TaxID=3039483 RepID=UPI0029529202|nr:uncharacterized protein HK407_08g13170 [Ordospora pajunii]KAH9411047.1 hypothetical protein HK407_08g13170 [Ordospora pajunii]